MAAWTADRGSRRTLHRAVIPAAAAASAALIPAAAAAASAPDCRRPPRTLVYACADATLEAGISALGVAYRIAQEDARRRGGQRTLRKGHARWLGDMGACGNDEACLAAALTARQRAMNEGRLGTGTPAGTEGTANADTQPGLQGVMRGDPRSADPPEPARRVAYEPSAVDVRTTWPEPPRSAHADPVPVPPPVATTAATPAGQVDRDASYGRVLLGMVVSASVPALVAFLLGRRGRGAAGPPRCPECDGTRIRTQAVADGRPGYTRRMGRGNRPHEIRSERIVRTCPCGYSSDRATMRVDRRPELLLTLDQRIGPAETGAPVL